MTSSAIASTNIALVPNTANVIAGQKVELVVYANSNGSRNGTVKVDISYPADLLSVSSFTQSPIWMSNTESGYDLIDNTNGTIIKTAGYPRGFSSIVPFGTITFTAKKVGVATVKITNDSLALDASGKNVFSGNSESIIDITARAVADVITTSTTTPGLTGQEATVGSALDGIIGTSTDDNLTASVFGSIMNANLWYVIGGLLLLAIILWILFWIKRRKDEEENNINK